MRGHQTTSKRSRGGNTAAQHSFAQIPKVSTPRSSFNRSCGFKTTFDSGYLVPCFVDEALPGDTMSMNMTSFARMATPLHPLMDNMRMEVFFFAVPLRLLWTNFQKFMGEQTDPGDETEDFVVPQLNPGGSGSARDSTLWDYFGLPRDSTNSQTAAAFHFRAYSLIWNDWFRDENLQDSAQVDLDDGPDVIADYPLRRRGKRHDYFTSCLPWPQKGSAVELPLGTSAPVITDGTNPTMDFLVTPVAARGLVGAEADASYSFDAVGGGSGGANQDVEWVNSGLQADLTSATAATINQIREAFQIQKLYERDARGGTRYTEILLSHFGVTSPDARLQRPEYLGGGGANISINPVAQTTATDGTEVKGSLAAYVTSSNTYPSWTKSFTEHCVILGLVHVRADLNYQEGMNKMWTRTTRWDYYWPALAHIGEQAVLNKELHMDSTSGAEDDLVFGYQERWAEYRYKPSTITGQFRSSVFTSLDTWHLAQDFGEVVPSLNAAFIEDTPPIARAIAVPGEPEFLLDAYFQYTCVRPMPTYSVPGLIDHF